MHRDYCDEDKTYVCKMQDFTRNESVLVKFIESAEADGGGDAPECYEYVLKKMREDFRWRDGDRKTHV